MAEHRGPTPTGAVVSVNIGEPREVDWGGRRVRTAIWKWPTDRRVPVDHDNLDGDAQADLRVHGGPDKAVYAYSTEDYRWWGGRLGTGVDPGTFGENLTTEGIELADAVIGEVWAVGTTKLQVAQTRQPCFKLGIRMDDAGFVQKFHAAHRFGVYLRIVEVGELGVGDEILVVSRPTHGLTAGAFADTLDSGDPVQIRRLLEIDEVPRGAKVWALRQLDRAGRGEA
jgi:MOSC domain-containing protein YiiM